jgi:thioredoxin reductase (NADPH)
MSKVYDVLIIGAGPAGLSAGLYAGRARLSTLIIEKEKDGGQIVLTSEVENYPGCLEGESGPTLVDRMADQAKHFGAEKVYDEIVEVKLEGKEKVLKCTVYVYNSKFAIIFL